MKKVIFIKFEKSDSHKVYNSDKVYWFLADERFSATALESMKIGKKANFTYLMYDVARKEISSAHIIAVSNVKKTDHVTKEVQFIVTGRSLKLGMEKIHLAMVAWPTAMDSSEIQDINANDVALKALEDHFKARKHRLYKKYDSSDRYLMLKQAQNLK